MNNKLIKLLIPSCLIIFTLLWLNFNNKSIKKKDRIGILQFVEHEALDASRNGFIDGIKEYGFDGEIIYKNAQADQSNCTLIANQFLSEGCDLILAIATPAAQSAAAIILDIPIVVTAVTDPKDAGIVKSNEKPETNVTGTSDLAPISEQVKLIKKIKPESENVAILFSSNEANSKFQAQIAFEEIQKINLNPFFYTFSQMTEIQQVVESMYGKIDAIYTPTDNMVASNMELISKTAKLFKIPIICGEVNLISKGATGTLGIDYYELGKISAKQAISILSNKTKIQDMPIEYFKNFKLVINSEII